MSAPKFTPGTWGAVPSHEHPKAWNVHAPDNSEYASPGDFQQVAELMTRPNAELVAAAPDLYAALEAVVALIERGDEQGVVLNKSGAAVEAARAALARARGEG